MAFGLKTWRRWHRKVNLKQRRHALASAIASTAVTSLVMARGHRVSKVAQFPLVVDDAFGNVSKTREALEILNKLGASEDLQKVSDKKKMRSGKSKARGKRHKNRLGPLIIVNDKSESLYRATRNVPGVSLLNVNRLNIRHLAPGGQLGRFCIYTQGAFTELEQQFGSYKGTALKKKGYQLKRECVNTPEISAIINSDVVQRVLREKRTCRPLHPRQKKNPLKNVELMNVLNPYAPAIRAEKLAQRGKRIRKTRKSTQQFKDRSAALLNVVSQKLDVAEQEIDKDYRDELALTKV
jgi:large subunit ribosomal protein L4e